MTNIKIIRNEAARIAALLGYTLDDAGNLWSDDGRRLVKVYTTPADALRELSKLL